MATLFTALSATSHSTVSMQSLLSQSQLMRARRSADQAEQNAQQLRSKADQAEREARRWRGEAQALAAQLALPTATGQADAAPGIAVATPAQSPAQDLLSRRYQSADSTASGTLQRNTLGQATGRLLDLSA